MRRLVALLLAVLAFAALAGALWLGVEVWATVYPQSAWLARGARWPLLGPWLAAVRARHVEGPLPAEPPHPSWVWVIGGDDSTAGGRVARGALAPPVTGGIAPAPEDLPRLPPGVWPEQWIAPGEVLRAQPNLDAPSVATASGVANVPVLAARGDWRRVRWQGVEGWVRVEPQAGPPLGSAPEPVRPLPGRRPDPARLAAARALLGASQRVERVGPYRLLTDVADPFLLWQLDRAAATLESVYTRRYGVTPVGVPAEAVVLFRDRAAYDTYLARTGGFHAETGHVAAGVVALYREGRLADDVRATLVHELAHVLDRRALGPALPPWLDEGIADDLGMSRVDERGAVVPGTTSAPTLRLGPVYEVHGGEAARSLAREAIAGGRWVPLPRLLALDAADLQGPEPRPLVYAEASFLVRFLLASPHAAGFHAFLLAVAAGGDPGAEALARAVGTPLTSLDEELRGWLSAAPAWTP